MRLKQELIDQMPLAKRIIPCLDMKDGRVVKGEHFVNLRDAGDPVRLASLYRDQGADELVFLDITASIEKREIRINLVRDAARTLDIPFTVGGGIRNLEDVREILCSGADKVAVNTAAVENPSLITDIADIFGQQCVVIAVDAARVHSNGKERYQVRTYGARKKTELDALEWSRQCEQAGAGEILLTSIDRDGTLDGFDLPLTSAVCSSVRVPVIASGGCGTKEHFLKVFSETSADAALAASVFHYGTFTIPDVKNYLKQHGIEMRL
jgi:imidazole glycerol-phosphate synthase subunit HisF